MMTYMDTSSMSVNKNQNYYTFIFVKVVIVYYVKKISVYFIVALCQILMALKWQSNWAERYTNKFKLRSTIRSKTEESSRYMKVYLVLAIGFDDGFIIIFRSNNLIFKRRTFKN